MTREIDEKVKWYISKYQLIAAGDEIVVGVSGGADSMMLLHFLNRYKEFYQIKLKIAHIHHGLRSAADLDVEHVREVAKRWGIECHVKYCQIKEVAAHYQMSEEEAGRKERYDFFISLTNENGKIATAHNMNDQAETMMMRFFRGTDVQGLKGIPPKRGQIIRPILGITREEIEDYCHRWSIEYQQDETNFETIYTRNKIRLECIPYVKENFNPNVIKVLARQSETYQEADEFLKDYTQKVFKKVAMCKDYQVVLSKKELLKVKPYIQKRLMLEAIHSLLGHTKEITSAHVKSLVELSCKQTGKCIDLPFGLSVNNDYEHLVFKMKEEGKITNYEYTLQMGTTSIKEAFLLMKVSLITFKTFEQREENMYTKYIDYDKIKDSLQIRNRQPLDSITLPGGTKKLKKFFTDEKISQQLRNTMPLVADGNDIVWIIGSRLNSKYYVTEKTVQILELTVLKEHTLQEGLC